MKYKLVLLFLSPIVVLIILGVRNYSFQNYINKYFSKDNFSIELEDIGWLNRNDYIFNKSINASAQLKKIIEGEESSADFERGGQHPFFCFKITSSDAATIFLTLTIHDSQGTVELTFSDRKNQISYKKKIEKTKIFDEFIYCFYVNGT